MDDPTCTGTPVDSKQSAQPAHQCSYCPRSFRSEALLARHTSRSHRKAAARKRFHCTNCNAGFNSPKNMALHRAVHAPKPFKCPRCAIIFRRHVSLVGHLERHYVSEEHICAVCDAEFGTLDELRVHVYEGHEAGVEKRKQPKFNVVPRPEKKTYKCTICENKTFPKKSLLERHFLIHTKQKPFECETCGKSFNQKSGLKMHSLIHSKTQDHICLLCGLKFSQKSNLKVHILRVHPKRTVPTADRLPCPYCPCLFKKLGSLNAHKTRAHAALLPDPTELVEQKVEESTEAAEVIVQETLYGCDTCDSAFMSMPELEEHMATHSQPIITETIVPIVPSRTQEHLLAFSEDRRYSCDICQAAFKKSSHLGQHIKSHYGIHGHRCEICGKTFTTSHSLKVHRDSHSTDYGCDQCAARFSQPSSLKRHAKLHENPNQSYGCPICSRSFKAIQSCRTHIRSTHGKEVAPVVTVTCIPEAASLEVEDSLVDLNTSSPSVPMFDLNSAVNCIVQIDDQLYEIPVQLSADQHILEIVQEPAADQDQPSVSYQLVPTVEDELFQFINETSNDEPLQDNPTPPPDPDPQPPDSDPLPPNEPRDLFSERIENGRKSYPCQGCPKIFKKPVDLRRHIRTHTGERPFKCDLCPKSFTLKAVLQKHLQTHESHREMLACSEPGCNGKFSSTTSLQLHRRIHTGDRPFRCSVCTLTFRTSGHLQAHMSSHVRLAKRREQELMEFCQGK